MTSSALPVHPALTPRLCNFSANKPIDLVKFFYPITIFSDSIYRNFFQMTLVNMPLSSNFSPTASPKAQKFDLLPTFLYNYYIRKKV